MDDGNAMTFTTLYPQGIGGWGTLYNYCQYRVVPLTWVGLSASLVHSWVANSHILTEFWYINGLQVWSFLTAPQYAVKVRHHKA